MSGSAHRHRHRPSDAACHAVHRALGLWPRLDRRALSRCGHDTACIARVVSKRTSVPPEHVRALLEMQPVPGDEGLRWLG